MNTCNIVNKFDAQVLLSYQYHCYFCIQYWNEFIIYLYVCIYIAHLPIKVCSEVLEQIRFTTFVTRFPQYL